jgi:cytosine/adenosine deaminase-related metal-dependent hydrolase
MRKQVIQLASAGLLSLTSIWAAAPIVIQNGTIMTVTKGTIEKGSVVMQDGKIIAVGAKVNVPAGATIVDATGKFVIPGIIDCHSHIATEAVNEGTLSVTSMVGIGDTLNPEDIAIYRAMAGGVTTANILHGSANSIGGKTVVVKMRWDHSGSEILFEDALPGIKFALGENPKRRGAAAMPGLSMAPRYPATRMGVEDVIREAFNDAKSYKATWADYNAKLAKGVVAIPPAHDLKLDALVEVLDGKRYVHSHCYRQDEILMLLRVADDYGFKIRTLQHVLEGYKVAKEIAAHGAGASTFSDWWAYKVEAYDAIPYTATLMMKKGVLVSLNSDDAELMRHLNTEAAKAMKYGGATETEALSMVTINPAKQLGIEKRVGSLEVGKDGDVVIYDQHPLSTFTKVEKVFIDGQLYFDREKDLADRPSKEREKKALITKAAEEQKKNAPQGGGRRGGL